MLLDAQNVVTVVVGGMVYSGWKTVRITDGIERCSCDFEIGTSFKWRSSGRTQLIETINAVGYECVVYIGNDKVLTGFADAAPVQYDANSITSSLSGRSKTGDLVDCCALDSPGQWSNQKLEKIAEDIAKPYGVKIVTEIDTGAPLVDHQIQQGETAYESIDRMMKLRQLLATDNADGDLVFIKPGSKRATTSLVLGKNIVSCSHFGDWRDRYSRYVLKGQMYGSDADSYQKKGIVEDKEVKRFRYLLIQQYGQADGTACQNRAAYEKDRRAAKSKAVSYRVDGWRQEDGKLWEKNSLVYLFDPFLGHDGDMLITEVSREIDDSGMFTMLSLMPPEAFEAIV